MELADNTFIICSYFQIEKRKAGMSAKRTKQASHALVCPKLGDSLSFAALGLTQQRNAFLTIGQHHRRLD